MGEVGNAATLEERFFHCLSHFAILLSTPAANAPLGQRWSRSRRGERQVEGLGSVLAVVTGITLRGRQDTHLKLPPSQGQSLLGSGRDLRYS